MWLEALGGISESEWDNGLVRSGKTQQPQKHGALKLRHWPAYYEREPCACGSAQGRASVWMKGQAPGVSQKIFACTP